MGVDVTWDCERSRTPEGYYPVRGGIEYAIAKSLAVAPFADIIWMETKTANLPYAKRFADAIHAKFPNQMLAYNLSPSFNWDTTGMSEQEMRDFPAEIGKLGYVFDFITYGGHQVDGLASEEFATALKQDGMLALARLQRKLRLVESPYKTPQSLVGGPRLDSALIACSGRHRDHEGHGQRFHASAAPRANRSARQAAGGLAAAFGARNTEFPVRCVSNCGPILPVQACCRWCSSDPAGRQGRTCDLRGDRRSAQEENSVTSI